MASDKYNFQYSVLTIIQKSYQYVLALMRYRAQCARQEEERLFYERIYGRAFENPDSIRIAYTQDDLTPQMMKELAAEHGIPVETDPYGKNFVIYDAKYEADLIRIVQEAEKRDRRIFEENHFHETQYGFECYYSGEYIPYKDPETGSYIDRDGRLHRGDHAEGLSDDDLIDRLDSRAFNPDAVWDRGPDGVLSDEFGDSYYPDYGPGGWDMEAFGQGPGRGNTRVPGMETTEEEGTFYAGTVYVREPGGYRSEEGFLYNYNEYGDYYNPQARRVYLNPEYGDHEEARIQRMLAREENPVNSGYRFFLTPDGNLQSVESGAAVVLRDAHGGLANNKELIQGPAEEIGEEREVLDGMPLQEEESRDTEAPEAWTDAEEGTQAHEEAILEDGAEPARKKKPAVHKQEESHAKEPEPGPAYEDSADMERGSEEPYAGYEAGTPETPEPTVQAEVGNGPGYEESAYSERVPEEPYTDADAGSSHEQESHYEGTPSEEAYKDSGYGPSGEASGSGYQDRLQDEAGAGYPHEQEPRYESVSSEEAYKSSGYGPSGEASGSGYQDRPQDEAGAGYSHEQEPRYESVSSEEAYKSSGYGPSGASSGPGYQAEAQDSSSYRAEPSRETYREAGDTYRERHNEENASTAARAREQERSEKWESIPHTGAWAGEGVSAAAHGAGAAAAAGASAAVLGSEAAATAAGAAARTVQSLDYESAIKAASPFHYEGGHGGESSPGYAGSSGYGGSTPTAREGKTDRQYDGTPQPQADKGTTRFQGWKESSNFGRPAGGTPDEGSVPSGRKNAAARPDTASPNEERKVEGSFRRKNREALFNYRDLSGTSSPLKNRGEGRQGGDGQEASSPAGRNDSKARKFGYERMTAQKKYGFNSISPGSRIQKPSAASLVGAFGSAYAQMAVGAEKDSKVHFIKYARNTEAVFNLVGGAFVYRNAAKSSANYFSTLQDSGSLSRLNNILTANGRKAASFSNAAGLRETNENLIRLARKHGLVEQRGKMLFYKKGSDAAILRRMGAMDAKDMAIMRNSVQNAISYKNGASMISRGAHVLSYSVRMAIMNSDDGTLGYVNQAIDTLRVFRQFGRSFSEAKDSGLLASPLKERKAVQAARQVTGKKNGLDAAGNASRWKGNFHVRKDAATPTGRRTLHAADEKVRKNAKAVKKYRELRQQQSRERFARLHKGIDGRAKKLDALKKIRAQRLQLRKKAGDALTDIIGRPVRVVKTRVLDTRIGRKLAVAKRKLAANALKKKAAREAWKQAAGKALSSAIQGVAKAISTVSHWLLIILGVYVLACIVIVLVTGLFAIPVLGTMSAETDDSSLASGTSMEDVYDKSNTMTGIIYNELRYIEVEWASEIRSYGTSLAPLSLDVMSFTEYGVSARQYVLSQTGADDLLGVWAYDSTKTSSDGTQKYEGILGPEPFDGAALEDYKLLRDIDGGSTLELRGKPQEGYTSNAKQITAMASVFYSQTLDTLLETANSGKGLSGWLATGKALWKALWTWFETENVPLLGWIAKTTGWSWTSVYRNYAYPLAQASHQENFFLSSYIYPTKYTYGISDSRWDGADGGNEDENGSQTVKIDQVTGQEAKNGRIGVSTEGGSGKVTSDFLVSNEIYQGQGDEGWEAIELCPEDLYNGYGCQMRMSFYYKYNGHFATDSSLNVTYADELSTLYYGYNPNEESEFTDGGNDVSADVSPWGTDSEQEQGYNRDSCLIHILQLTNDASECWTLESRSSLTDYDFQEETDMLQTTFNSSDMNSDYLNRGFFNTDPNLTIQQVVETEDGCDVYVSYPFETTYVYNEDTREYEAVTDYSVDGFILHFVHECQGNHEGYYCGGHLQLRTRGVVYGFSEEQSEDGAAAEDGELYNFEPKYLDPVNYDAENSDGLPDDDDAEEGEREAYPDLHVWNIEDHVLEDGETTPTIEESDLQLLYQAEDIFDIDDLIKRTEDSYPGYTDDGAEFLWTGWTYSNMSLAVSLAYTDWFETYALADTQTMVGSVYDNEADNLNNLSDAVVERITELLAGDLNLGADILDPEATNYDGEILTDEQRERIDRVRHVLYALSCVGEVSYSQSAHANMYGNLRGHTTDCSGFVCNIWRDRIDAALTVNGLYNNSEVTPQEYHGIDTEGIEPGDIILVNPDSADGEAHALIYVGTFNTADLYGDGEGEGEERVFVVDCSSMVFNVNDLASQEDTPVESLLTKDGATYTLADGFAEYSQVEDVPKVRSGNVRFADREYVNADTDGMYYIDMYEWSRIGQRQLFDDYSDLGDTGVDYWKSSAILTDLTQTRQEMDIEFDVDDYVLRDAVEDVELPDEDDLITPDEDPDDPVVDGNTVILQMNQYIQQTNKSYASQYRGYSSTTIGSSGCTDCSYLMVASYYTGQTFDVGSILSNTGYYSGSMFETGKFLSDYGLSETRVSGFSISAIRDAIDQGYPVVIKIKGKFSFHNSNSTHFLVIMGYCDDGFMVYDPGNAGVSYCTNGTVISYDTFTNSEGSVEEYRIVTKD